MDALVTGTTPMHREIESACDAARSARAGGHRAEALAHYTHAVALARTGGDDDTLAYVLRHLSDVAREQGEAANALAASEEAVALYRTHAPDSLDLANALRLRALALHALDRRVDAHPAWAEARDLYAQLGVDAGVRECERFLESAGSRGATTPGTE